MNQLVILDIGCKFGLHPSNIPLMNIAEHHLIDADLEEINYLKQHYQQYNQIHCSCFAITSPEEARHEKLLQLNELNHPGGNTFLKPDHESYYWKEFRKGSGNIKNTSKVNTTTLDLYCIENDIKPQFLKIDVEGYEENVLKGASHALETSVLGVRIEVEFNSLYQDKAGSFSSVNNILTRHGFEFFNFDFAKNSFVPFSDFFGEGNFGQLVGCDAIYMKPLGYIINKAPEEQLNYAIFAMLNGLEDLALRLLTEQTKYKSLKDAFEPKNSDIHSMNKIKFLEKHCARLFFNLRDKPRYSLGEFGDVWEQIFGEKWIQHGEFFRKYPLT